MRRDHGISIYPVLLVNFIGTLGYSIVMPFMIFLVDRLGGNGLIYGVIAATYPALQLIGAPILGRWSDTFGRRKVLFLSQAGTLVAWGIFIVAVISAKFVPRTVLFASKGGLLGTFTLTMPLLLIFAARALDSLTGGNVSVAHAYLADVTPDADRSRNFGRMAISSNLGFIVGPALAGVLGTTVWGEAIPAVAAFTISLVALLVIGLYLPESVPCALGPAEQASVRKVFGQEQVDCYEAEKNRDVSLGRALRQPHVRFLLVQGPLLSALSKRFSDATLVLIGGGILGANFILLTQHDRLIIYAAAGLFAVGNGLMWPSFLAILSRSAGSMQGTVQGFAGSAGSAASITGLIAGGLLYDVIGSKVFLLSAVVIYSVTVLGFRLRRICGPPPAAIPGNRGAARQDA